jgi:trehalose 6-phosphate phosphatase
MTLPHITGADSFAFFLDFDGTLTEIADRPDAVRIEARTREALAVLQQATGGALAVITGREIEAIDAFLSPLALPVAGVHGLEQRSHNGDRRSAAIDVAAIAFAEAALAPLAQAEPGLLLERKRGALALHYRARPDLEADCVRWVEAAIANSPDVTITRGKMVVEARFHAATKGTAVLDFLAELPFAGRTPVFAGDDVTDEDAFAAVNTLGGISIKVGAGETRAIHRAVDVTEFLDWLCGLAAGFTERTTA